MGNRKGQSIPNQQLPNKEKIKFSFEFYDISGKYCISDWNKAQIKMALTRLQDVCTKNFFELRRDERVYHFGEVIWEKTIEKKGFPNTAVNSLPAFHFALLGVNGQMTRVYGAFSSGIFYVVWFDLNHLIWPTPLRNT